jgi:hypothetical protein
MKSILPVIAAGALAAAQLSPPSVLVRGLARCSRNTPLRSSH